MYDEIEPGLRERVEDVVLNRRAPGGESPTERLVAFAETVKSQGEVSTEDLAWREAGVEERLSHALVKGITSLHHRGYGGGAPQVSLGRYTSSKAR